MAVDISSDFYFNIYGGTEYEDILLVQTVRLWLWLLMAALRLHGLRTSITRRIRLPKTHKNF